MTDKKLVNLELTSLHETKIGEKDKGAYLFENQQGEKVWVPKFACQDDQDGTFTVEEQWAIDKGLI